MCPNSEGCTRSMQAPLKCEMPPCPCAMCVERRAKGEPDRKQCADAAVTNQNYRLDLAVNFGSFFTEFLGIIAFFIIATSMFWVSVVRYVYICTVKISKSKRNEKAAALVLILLLIFSIGFSSVQKSFRVRRARRVAAAAAAAAPPNLGMLDGMTDAIGKACNRAGQMMRRHNVTITITDSEARQIFKQSRLYSIPSEMKQPPAFLLYLRDVILRPPAIA